MIILNEKSGFSHLSRAIDELKVFLRMLFSLQVWAEEQLLLMAFDLTQFCFKYWKISSDQPHTTVLVQRGQPAHDGLACVMGDGAVQQSLKASKSDRVWSPDGRVAQAWTELRRSLAQPPVLSRVSSGVRPGCSWLHPAGTQKPPKAETAPPLWLSSWGKSVSLHPGLTFLFQFMFVALIYPHSGQPSSIFLMTSTEALRAALRSPQSHLFSWLNKPSPHRASALQPLPFQDPSVLIQFIVICPVLGVQEWSN